MLSELGGSGKILTDNRTDAERMTAFVEDTQAAVFVCDGASKDNVFSYSNCTDPRFLLQWTYNNMSVGAQTTLNDGTSGYGLSGTVNAVSLTVQSSSLISFANSGSGQCGKTDWTLDVGVDVTGVASCLGSDMPTRGTAYGDKYRVSGTNLYLNNLSGTTLTKQ